MKAFTIATQSSTLFFVPTCDEVWEALYDWKGKPVSQSSDLFIFFVFTCDELRWSGGGGRAFYDWGAWKVMCGNEVQKDVRSETCNDVHA